MAAVSIPPSPYDIGSMAGRRAPLSNLPNAGNSPFRALTTSNKRLRSHSNAENENSYDQSAPPTKKQLVERDASVPRTPRKQIQPAVSKRADVGAVERKAPAMRDRQIVGRITKQENNETQSHCADTIRQWQNHYRKVFPSYVFYFESVPEDARRQCLKSILALGAREEKFFSKDVTHVVTTRAIPSGSETGSSITSNTTPKQASVQPRTINPSLLEKQTISQAPNPKSKFTFETSLNRRLPTIAQDLDQHPRRASGRADVLQRAKDMGMKIWQLEKLQRVLDTILEDGESQPGYNTRSNLANAAQAVKATKQTDLSQMIKNEQLHGTGDRELNLAIADLVSLKGPYIYVRCMNEKTKPVMVREYPKVQRREDGEWPQFRSASLGKCPFVEEDSHTRRSAEREKEKAKEEERITRAKAEARKAALRTRADTAQVSQMQPPTNTIGKKPLRELAPTAYNKSQLGQQAQQLPPPPAANDPTFSKASELRKEEGLASNFRGGFMRTEPMASGMQASNVTSAIRSQMISSTAAAPGSKAGTSKEIHGLQRKVLERNNGAALGGLGQRAQGMTDIAAAARATRSNPRVAKQKAQEKLGQKHDLTKIAEDLTPSELEERGLEGNGKASQIIRDEKHEPKPGYCENCREKFEDFEEHTYNRKHRKFAANQENWKELDNLLSSLTRTRRDEHFTSGST